RQAAHGQTRFFTASRAPPWMEPDLSALSSSTIKEISTARLPQEGAAMVVRSSNCLLPPHPEAHGLRLYCGPTALATQRMDLSFMEKLLWTRMATFTGPPTRADLMAQGRCSNSWRRRFQAAIGRNESSTILEQSRMTEQIPGLGYCFAAAFYTARP